MKRPSFNGVAVYPKRMPKSGQAVLVGVWIGQRITSEQRKVLQENAKNYPGQIGVRENQNGSTSISFIGRIPKADEARKIASSLSQTVCRLTGARSIMRELPNYAAVRHALAG